MNNENIKNCGICKAVCVQAGHQATRTNCPDYTDGKAPGTQDSSGSAEFALLTVERNYCTCHPETCSCDDWRLMYDGEELARNHNKSKLDKLIKIMRSI